MSYIQRSARDSLETLSHMFGAVLVTGARQVGKSTLLEHLTSATNKVSIHTMDDANTLEAARTDPGTFLALNPPPLLLDEIQKAPSLFPFIKMEIDRSRGKGLYFMSGSEQFSMMEQVSESLAGRIGILTLMGISLREELIWKAQEQAETLVGQSESFLSREALRFIPTDEALKERAPSIPKLDVDDLWRILHRGSMPELVCHPQYDWSMFYGSYVQTYVERDVRRLTQVDDEIQFQTFMRVIAARTGQMLNISEVAQEVGIRDVKAKKWLSVLQASHLVYLLKPFYTNHTKRAIKTPKLYMTDTGLAAYLTRWSNHRVLQEGALSGAFFETFVIGEVLKSYYNAGELDPPLYYYRDKDKREIDLLIMQGDTLHPLEIKKSANPHVSDTRSFKVLDNIDGFNRGSGGVICAAESLLPLGAQDRIIPVTYL